MEVIHDNNYPDKKGLVIMKYDTSIIFFYPNLETGIHTLCNGELEKSYTLSNVDTLDFSYRRALEKLNTTEGYSKIMKELISDMLKWNAIGQQKIHEKGECPVCYEHTDLIILHEGVGVPHCTCKKCSRQFDKCPLCRIDILRF